MDAMRSGTVGKQYLNRVALLGWDLRRAIRAWTRRFGLLGIVLPASVVLCSVDIYFVWTRARLAEQIRFSEGTRAEVPVVTPSPHAHVGLERVRAFDDLLVPHDEIPSVVEDILQAATDERVTIAHAEYQVEADVPGRFLRYRMSFPAAGEASAIVRFMERALRGHRTLTLESVRLTRQLPDASRVEARVQWVLLTHTAGKTGAGTDRRQYSSVAGTSQ